MSKLFVEFKKGVAHIENTLWPRDRAGYRQDSPARRRYEDACNDFFDGIESRGNGFQGPVLVDGCWDNPHYWFRLRMLFSALKIDPRQCWGFTGRYHSRCVSKAFKRMNIRSHSFDRWAKVDTDWIKEAEKISTPEEFFKFIFPENFPAGYVYDYILKRQAVGVPAFEKISFKKYLREWFEGFFSAVGMLDELSPSLVVLSHSLGDLDAPLVWLATKRSIPVVILYGDFGTTRFIKIHFPEDLFLGQSRPVSGDLEKISAGQVERLRGTGQNYIQKRLSGTTSDIGAQKAYGSDTRTCGRGDWCHQFGWDEKRPIVCIYTATWFDWPHVYGMRNFQDMKDWVDAMFEVIVKCKSTHWLIRPHPCESWYGKTSISDYVNDLGLDHIRILPSGLNGADVLRNVDGVVTYHGTIGLEAAALGKPVLIADRGWYHSMGFSVFPETRSEFLDHLSNGKWLQSTSPKTIEKASVFAGLQFGRPQWQGNWLLEDDSEQFALYEKIPKMLKNYRLEIVREIDGIAEWWKTKHNCYHVWKMLQASDYTV